MKNSENTPITIPATDETKTLVSNKNNAQKTSSNRSSQQQLMTLAKNFSLDGALLAEDKKLPVSERAVRRERIVLIKQQQNLENIISKAIDFCDDENAVNKTDQDWFNSFIPLAENISNQTMQGLWAKVLAAEISKPGSFSLKALNVFKNMSIFDAKLFAKACALACHDTKKLNYRIISGCTQQPSIFNIFNKQRQQVINLNAFGISYGDILSLAENHLIFKQETETSMFEKNGNLTMDFNGISLILTANKNNTLFSFYKFTPVGVELARLISNAPEMDYLQSLKTQFNHHFSIQSKD